jgi:flavin reductase (DIM6/NTAB) family NADH-FMN oxidoreductase RutF
VSPVIETSLNKASLLVPVPILLTTVDSFGKPNISSVSYYACINFEPPTVAISLHPNRKTSSNLIETSKFVINVPPRNQQMADLVIQVSGLSGAEIDKFDRFDIDVEVEPNWPPYMKNAILCLFGAIKEKINYSDNRILFLGEIEKALMGETLNVKEEKPEFIWKLFERNCLSHSEVYISKEGTT